MATHPSVLAWEIPWTEEPGGRESMGARESQTGISFYKKRVKTATKLDNPITPFIK